VTKITPAQVSALIHSAVATLLVVSGSLRPGMNGLDWTKLAIAAAIAGAHVASTYFQTPKAAQ
jgi:uncharacterized membrane protein